MKIGLRLLLSYALILALAAWFVLTVFVAEVKPGVRATLEDSLVDTAQLLAQLVSDDVNQAGAGGQLSQALMLQRLQKISARQMDVEISGVHKKALDYRVYITDARGIVIFDSSGRDLGKDYSRWNDVYLTLRGQYGARSTRTDAQDENSAVMHVAAAIYANDAQPDQSTPRRIIGVLTVAKASAAIRPFIERSQYKILQRSFWLLIATLLIGLGFSWWLNRSLQKLRHYVMAVERNEKVNLPQLGQHEIGELGLALEHMRHQLEGKQYVETLMHTLAHELKSPIAAIQGSAELLSEDPPAAERSKFLHNIIEQNQRQKQLIDKLLALIKVEKQQQLSQVSDINIVDLLDQVLLDFSDAIARKNLRIKFEVQTHTLQGDPLLLRQAIGNLLDNAIAFSPHGAEIHLHQQVDEEHFTLLIDDQGSGIPDYAMDKIFERFYSLPRADAAKSTGLGLPFVREVISLHGGDVSLENLVRGGVRVSLRLALA